MPEDQVKESSQRIIVVGGGAIGLTIAWDAIRRGHHVTVLDRADIGRGTSWAAAGILPPNRWESSTDPLDQLRGYSHSLIESVCEQIHAVSGVDPEYKKCGGWYLAGTPGEAAAMTGMVQYWRDLDIHCEQVKLQDVAGREPALAAWVGQSNERANVRKHAWFAPGEHQIRPPLLLKALRESCVAKGAAMMPGVNIEKICESSTSVTCDLQDGRTVIGDTIVLSGGSHTGFIDESLSLQNSLVPIRGQILLLKTDQPLLNSVVNVGHRYVLCRQDGNTLVGSCEEEVGFDGSTTDDAIDGLHRFAADLIPDLKDAKVVDRWAGLRPLTFDGFPMIGRVPNRDSIYVASGHFRSGIHCSFGTARLILDLIEDRMTAIDVSPFRVGKQQTHTIA